MSVTVSGSVTITCTTQIEFDNTLAFLADAVTVPTSGITGYQTTSPLVLSVSVGFAMTPPPVDE
jgi:hypothetical protein